MADFSKQYCEKYDPEMPWDFDIDKEFDDMPFSSFRPIICEGYGFFGLHKDVDGRLYCLFGDEWVPVPYEEITDKTYLKYISK
jgi:hypothetical protein